MAGSVTCHNVVQMCSEFVCGQEFGAQVDRFHERAVPFWRG